MIEQLYKYYIYTVQNVILENLNNLSDKTLYK